MKLLINGYEADLSVDSLTVTDSETGQADSLRLSIRRADVDAQTVEVIDGGIKTGALTVVCAERTRELLFLTATALPPSARVQRYQSWEDVSLSRLIAEFAGRLGLSVKSYGLPQVFYPWLAQRGEDDCAFLRERLALEGLHMKLAPGSLIVYDAKTFDAGAPVREFDPGAYQRIERTYQMKRTATVRCESVEGRFSCPLPGGEILRTDILARSVGEAQRYARGLLRAANEDAETLSFTAAIDTEIAAGCVFSALGESWIVRRVTHDLINRTSKIEGRRPLLW